MDDEKKTTELVPQTTSLDLSSTNLDLGALAPEAQAEIHKLHAQKQIDIQAKAQELALDAKALDQTLGTIENATEMAINSGANQKITHAVENKLGHTEIIISTDEAAARMDLNKSQRGNHRGIGGNRGGLSKHL